MVEGGTALVVGDEASVVVSWCVSGLLIVGGLKVPLFSSIDSRLPVFIDYPFSTELLKGTVDTSDSFQRLVSRSDTKLPFCRLGLLLRNWCHTSRSLVSFVKFQLAA